MSERIPVSSALDEEIARAELYGLLARLWYAAPDAELLEAFQAAARLQVVLQRRQVAVVPVHVHVIDLAARAGGEEDPDCGAFAFVR